MIARQAAALVYRGFWPILWFELLYKGVAALLVSPLCALLFCFSLQQAGLTYLSNQNIIQYISSPYTVVLFLLLCLALSFYTFLEISFLASYFRCFFSGAPVSCRPLFLASLRRSLAVLKPQNWPLLFFLLLLLPLGSAVLVSSFLPAIGIPGFILQFIEASPWLSLAFGMLVALFLLYAVRLAFSVHFFVLDGDDFWQAQRKSKNFVRGHFIKTVLALLVGNGLALLGIVLFLFLLTLLLVWAGQVLAPQGYSYAFFLSVTELGYFMIFLLASFFSVPYQFGLLSALFERWQGRSLQEIPVPPKEKSRLGKRLGKILLLVGGLLLLLGNTISWQYLLKSNAFGHFAIGQGPDITAHRGDTQHAPENTLAAIRSAIAAGADYVEIDVQLTKDGELILLHDATFERTAGLPMKAADLTLAQVKELDVGFLFDPHFAGEQVPTLGEALKIARGHVILNIEVKAHGKNEAAVAKLLAEIKMARADDFVVISSTDYDVLQKVKQLVPRMPTGYIMAMAVGDFISLPAADFFSLELSFVGPDLVAKIQDAGKEIHVWTVNQKADMERLFHMGIDNIITDQTELALRLRQEAGQNQPWLMLWRQIFS